MLDIGDPGRHQHEGLYKLVVGFLREELRAQLKIVFLTPILVTKQARDTSTLLLTAKPLTY